MHKKAIVILLSCMLSIPMLTGCNSEDEVHIKLFGKEVYSREKDNKEIEDKTEDYQQQTPSSKHTADEAVEAIATGSYSITYNNQEYTVEMETILNTLFPNCEIYTQFIDENTCLVKFQSGDNYIVYRLSFLTGTLVEQELCYNGTIFTDDEAHNNLLNLIVTEIIDKEEPTTNDNKKSESNLKCKHCGKSYKKSKSDASEPNKYCSSECYTEARMLEKKKKEEEIEKKESNLCVCKYCGKKYDPKESNCWENETYCSKQCQVDYEEKQNAKQQKTCKWCNTNKLPIGAGDEDKCKECQQENWNWHCNDCNKSMSLSEYNSTGRETGFCPPCYEKYKQTTQHTDVDHKHYYCGRCGRDVTGKNFLPDIEGYDFLCEACLLDLGY